MSSLRLTKHLKSKRHDKIQPVIPSFDEINY